MADTILSNGISFSGALGISVLGIVIVFTVLVLLLVFIFFMSKIIRGFRGNKNMPAETISDVSPEQIEAAGSCGDLKLYNVSDRDAAMVMAIVADELKEPLSRLRFISIKEVTNQ